MRQDSKNEDKENNVKTADKQNAIEVLDQCKLTDEKQWVKSSTSENQEAVDREQMNVDTLCEKQNVSDSLEKATAGLNEKEKINVDDTKKVDTRQKPIDNKLNPPPRTQLTLEEKRKSAPVKPELPEDWTKPVFNKQSSLEEKSR